MPKRNSRRAFDPHGDARTSAKVADWRTLTTDDIDRKMRGYLGGYQRNIAKTQAWYLNARAQRGLGDGAPNYILSDFRFKDYGFPVSWIPPGPDSYGIVPNGAIRKWQFIAFHCFGESYDNKILNNNRGLVSVPTDVNGHNPRRWMAGLRTLTTWNNKGRAVSVHFSISRRGDFVSSVDLNDLAYATAGEVALGFGKNANSVGFEFESHLGRFIYGTNKRTEAIYRQPYSQKQILCLAVALKKINSWRSVVKIEWRATPTEIINAAKASAGGCIQHRTVSPRTRSDPGGQFNIPKGVKAAFGSPMWRGRGESTSGPGPMMESGWDQLERYYNKVRAVNPATQAFQKPLTPSAIQLAKASEIMNLVPHAGQATAARAGRQRLAALSRSEAMQGQSRRALYSRAAANNRSLSAQVAQSTAAVSAILRRFDLSAVSGVENAVMFNEETGLWEDGKA